MTDIDRWLRDADMCVKLAACGDSGSFAKASALIQRARDALAAADQPDDALGLCPVCGEGPSCHFEGECMTPTQKVRKTADMVVRLTEETDALIATGAADQQSARKGLDELTRMAQEDGLYDVEQCAPPAKVGDVVTFADGRKFVVTSTPDKT
jgi:hypothetical protein